MAGHSRRFKEVGYDKPKFLLDCGNKKMISYTLEMFSSLDTFHLILSKEFEKNLNIKNLLLSLMPNVHLYFIKSHEYGPTYTISEADLKIENDSEIIICYCDFTVSWDYEMFKRQAYGYDAAAPFFSGFQAASLGNTKYAYMRHNDLNMIELKEKESFTENRLNEPASTGIYYFKSYEYFRFLAAKLFSSKKKLPNNEFYTSLLLNEIIDEDGSVLLFKVDKFVCFGTPEDLNQFNYWNSYFLYKKPASEKIFAETSIMPMAGEGRRFKNYGYKTSKPAIQIGDTSLIQKCISSLPGSNRSVYILKNEDYKNKRLIHDIEDSDKAKNFSYIPILKPTSGQAATCLLAEDFTNSNHSLIISSCDYELIYNSKELSKVCKLHDPDVVIFTFRLKSLPVGSYSNFAYCESDNFKVKKIIEKKCISDSPQEDEMVTGTFWFKKASFFFDAAKNLISNDIRVNNEHYVGTSLNFLIDQGFKVITFEVDQWISFGDPTELNLYYFWEDYFNESS
jgi:NDP-sugar pyrophosphorylase family protein